MRLLGKWVALAAVSIAAPAAAQEAAGDWVGVLVVSESVSLPVVLVFLLLSKFLVSGLTLGSVKE